MISVRDLTLSYGGRKIFDNVSIDISSKNKIGLVGRNGSGKSSFLKIISGTVKPEIGKIIIKKGLNIGYLPQELDLSDTTTVWQETISVYNYVEELKQKVDNISNQLQVRNDYTSASYLKLIDELDLINFRLQQFQTESLETKAKKVLLGLGFDKQDFDKHTIHLSEGWRMRIELAKILLQMPDILLLDEPTNHLDIESIQWLENYLKEFKGIIILVSHDRKFLDVITNRTVEIVKGKIYHYPVSFSQFEKLRKMRIDKQRAEWENQQKKIKQTKRFIERFRYKASKASQVQARIKMLEKQQSIEFDEFDNATIKFKFPSAPRSGDIVLEMRDLSKAYGNNLVLDKINLIVERGEKIAFVGRNGEGKTTLAKIIVGELNYKGFFRLGHNVNIGYYAQNQDQYLPKDKTVLEVMEEVAIGEAKSYVRDVLGSFLFSGDDIHKKVSILSGGERARLALATLVLQPYNLLVLDEPTNHLDILAKDILKQALKHFTGTLIVISHDRDFLMDLVDTVYYFRSHNLRQFRGGIQSFLEYYNVGSVRELEEKLILNTEKHIGEKQEKKSNKLIYEKRKQLQRQINRLKKKISEIEKQIDILEKEKDILNEKIQQGLTDSQIFKQYAEIDEQLKNLEDNWEQYYLELENLENELSSLS